MKSFIHCRRRRIFAATLTLCLVVSLTAGWTASATPGYSDGRLTIVTEPEEYSSYVDYYVGDEKKSAEDIVWSENGHTGKAISLTGNGEFLELNYAQLLVHKITFSGWFYWQGAASGADESTIHRQRLFTMSRNDNMWLSVMPHAQNAFLPEKARVDESDGKILDGIYLGFAYNNNTFSLWNPAESGRESYGLPLNEWHHVAFTMDGQFLKLYIDGRLWFEKMLILGVEEMRNNALDIGGGRWDDPTLNALIDDMAVYDFALTPEQIALLTAGVDPLSEGATLPSKTTLTLPQPTTTTLSDVSSQAPDGTVFGLPPFVVYLVGGLLIVFILLSVVLSVCRPGSSAKAQNSSKGGDRR